MPTRTLAIGVAETRIEPNASRTVLIIQKLVAANVLYVYDDHGTLYTTGTALSAQYDSLTLRSINGEEPEKEWFLYATGAVTTTNIIELFGTPKIVEVRITTEPEEPSPQEPDKPGKKMDAPKMKREKTVHYG